MWHLVDLAYKNSFTRANIVSGFESCGIATWNPMAIPDTAFAPSRPFDCHAATENTEHPLKWAKEKFPENNINSDVARVQPSEPTAYPHDSNPECPMTQEATVVDNTDNDNCISNVSEIPIEIVFQDGTLETVLIPVQNSPTTISSPNTESKNVQSLPAEMTQASTSWQSDIKSIFGPPQTKPSDVPKVSKKITSHRLLTHDNILALKKEEQEKKQKLEDEKENRKRKREEKKLEKENKKSKSLKVNPKQEKNVKSKTDKNTCCVCYQKWNNFDGLSWVACDECDRWMHQRCIPFFLADDLTAAINNRTDFSCHICTKKQK